MSSMQGVFSPYMLISSTLQTVFGYDRRKEQDKQADIAQQHQLELRKAREEFQDELEAQKIADIRAKMAVARRYRAEEKFESILLKHRTVELEAFFARCLPIKQKAIPILYEAAKSYKSLGYDSRCPLNVVLLRTKQATLNYDDIFNELDKSRNQLGNIEYRRWCDKDIAHNSAILNLHAIMSNIPTLVISPYFQGGSIHYTASMWEAQSETKPMIRPLFSIPCPMNYFLPPQGFTNEGKKAIQEQITLISMVVSGCARDSYMLMTQGGTPTFPSFLKTNPCILENLMKEENRQLYSFMINEYKTMSDLLSKSDCPSHLLSQEEMKHLAVMAQEATNELQCITHKSIKA